MNDWQKLDDKNSRHLIPKRAGVYELADTNKNVIYIGRSKKNLRQRISNHVQSSQNGCIHAHAVYYRYYRIRASRANERLLFQEYKSSHGLLIPLCNIRDDS